MLSLAAASAKPAVADASGAASLAEPLSFFCSRPGEISRTRNFQGDAIYPPSSFIPQTGCKVYFRRQYRPPPNCMLNKHRNAAGD
ncbi:hypothetical protein RHECNPAF_12210069 [Rhizobium etli CNPAF512]|nr:hypothetical protein RHECNPAF_12210069 [Rhizobium etli CNPAF512]